MGQVEFRIIGKAPWRSRARDEHIHEHIRRAVSGVSAIDVLRVFRHMYPDMVLTEQEDLADIEAWLVKLSRTPATALSTGRRNSDRGMFTCALLGVLGVPYPKTARVRDQLEMAIVQSRAGMSVRSET